jgi:hypothetical protein
MVCIEADGKRDSAICLGYARECDYAVQVSLRDGADAAHRHPELGEADGLSRFEEGVGLLVAKESGLHLHIGAVVVREGLAPLQAVLVHAPGPNLLAGKVGVVCVVDDSRVRMGVVNSHERLAAAVDKARNPTRSLIGDKAKVFSGGVDRPGVDVLEAVAGRKLHRVFNSGIIPDLDSGIAPPIEAVAEVAAVGQGDTLFEDGASGAQHDLDRPFHAVDAISIADRDRGAAVGRRGVSPINRGE